MQSLGKIKRGDTFAFTVEIRDKSTGEALTGAAEKLQCQGKYYGDNSVLCEMDISETETLGTYLFRADSTDEWRPGRQVDFDIEYRDGDVVSSTETFSVQVKVGVTNG